MGEGLYNKVFLACTLGRPCKVVSLVDNNKVPFALYGFLKSLIVASEKIQ